MVRKLAAHRWSLALPIVSALTFALAGCGGGAPGLDDRFGQTASALSAADQTAFDFFLAQGLTNFQAAGIVGNLDQESGMDPTAVESGGGAGRGIAQWSVGGRWDTDANDNVLAYATMQGMSPTSLQLQLDFIWYELQTFPGYGLAALQATTNVTDATIAFETDFEGCGTCDQSQRIAYAQAALTAYGDDTVDGGSTGDAGTCFVPSLNESGQCISTSDCAALADHVSTPGYCPGAANIECCTSTTSPDAAATDAGSKVDADVADSGTVEKDAAAIEDAGDGGRVAPRPVPVESDGQGSHGCSVAPVAGEAPSSGLDAGIFLAALGLVVGRRRRRELRS